MVLFVFAGGPSDPSSVVRSVVREQRPNMKPRAASCCRCSFFAFSRVTQLVAGARATCAVARHNRLSKFGLGLCHTKVKSVSINYTHLILGFLRIDQNPRIAFKMTFGLLFRSV